MFVKHKIHVKIYRNVLILIGKKKKKIIRLARMYVSAETRFIDSKSRVN